jgi:hypothetical protein
LFLFRELLPGLLAAEPFALLPDALPLLRFAALLTVRFELFDLALGITNNALHVLRSYLPACRTSSYFFDDINIQFQRLPGRYMSKVACI